MPFDFSGKKFLITGAGRGLGRELAKTLSDAGGEVYAVARNKENLDSLVKESQRIHAILLDLSDWDKTRSELEKVEVLDGVINNAAVSPPEQCSLDLPHDVIQHTLSVNLLAAINVIQITGKKMVTAKKRGSIVNVSSMNSVNPMAEIMSYNVSKAALDMVTKQFALELGPHQIRVNSVNPTVLLTDMGIEHWSEPVKANRLKSLTPMGRFCEVRECIEPIMYLLSDHSTMVTGTINPIDGGLLSNISA